MKFSKYDEAGRKYEMGSDWLNLKEGDNKVRIVSEFEDYGNHYDQKAKKSIICIGGEHCALCQAGDKPRVQFLGWAIDRTDNQVKLLRIGYKVFRQIGDLARSEEYAFEIIPDYDITIKRTGQGLDTDYSVLPARKNTELTDTEKAMIQKKVKDPKEIITSMKSKIGFIPPDVADEDIPIVEEDNEGIDAEKIPF